MPVQVQCSGCSKHYRVNDQFAGKRVQCKACGTTIHVPALLARPVTKNDGANLPRNKARSKSDEDDSSPQSTPQLPRASTPRTGVKGRATNTPPGRQSNHFTGLIGGIPPKLAFLGSLAVLIAATLGYAAYRSSRAVETVAVDAFSSVPSSGAAGIQPSAPQPQPHVPPTPERRPETVATAPLQSEIAEGKLKLPEDISAPPMAVAEQPDEPESETESMAEDGATSEPIELAAITEGRRNAVAQLGEPAPDFELELLNGDHFHLADARGDVIVLDFWATWCGPCRKALPQVNRIVKEFKSKNMQLVAVNLREAPPVINATLKRLQIRPKVALDKNGSVGARYEVRAIPRTVVIDREGTVVALFVGGGADFLKQLRAAIRKAALPKKP